MSAIKDYMIGEEDIAFKELERRGVFDRFIDFTPFGRWVHYKENDLQYLYEECEGFWTDADKVGIEEGAFANVIVEYLSRNDLKKVAHDTGYKYENLIAVYNEMIDDGETPEKAFDFVAGVSYEEDW